MECLHSLLNDELLMKCPSDKGRMHIKSKKSPSTLLFLPLVNFSVTVGVAGHIHNRIR